MPNDQCLLCKNFDLGITNACLVGLDADANDGNCPKFDDAA